MPHDDFHVAILSVCVDYLTLTMQAAQTSCKKFQNLQGGNKT